MCHYNRIPGRSATQSVKVSRLHSFTKSIILIMEKARLGISPEDKNLSASHGII